MVSVVRLRIAAIILMAAIVLTMAELAWAENASIPVFTPPGMIRVDGQDAAIDAKLRERTGPMLRHLGYFAEAQAWEDFAAGNSITEIPSVFAYIATPAIIENVEVSQADFEQIKTVARAAGRSGQARILDDQPRFITSHATATHMTRNKDLLVSEIITSIILVEGRAISLYSMNSAAPGQPRTAILEGHQTWRDAYLKKTGPGQRGGKMDKL
jgi:hypothetical protein